MFHSEKTHDVIIDISDDIYYFETIKVRLQVEDDYINDPGA